MLAALQKQAERLMYMNIWEELQIPRVIAMMEGMHYYPLTEAGVHLDDGTIISEGKLIDLVREAKVLLENKEYRKFEALTCGSRWRELPPEERDLVRGIILNLETGHCILDELDDISSMDNYATEIYDGPIT